MTRKPDHERIWLSPPDPDDDRMCCGDNIWSDIPEYADDPPTEYVRADLTAAKDAEIARLTGVIRTAATEIEAGCKAWALRTLHDALPPQ